MPNSAAEARAATSTVSTSSVVLGECLTDLALRLGQAKESNVYRPGDRIHGDALERLVWACETAAMSNSGAEDGWVTSTVSTASGVLGEFLTELALRLGQA